VTVLKNGGAGIQASSMLQEILTSGYFGLFPLLQVSSVTLLLHHSDITRLLVLHDGY
jgi:hypothetical protein